MIKVTWDEYSFMINGKRLMLMPVQSHGFQCRSFYVFWGILEPKRGEISFEGFRDLQPFFDAAKQAGIYLIARPGPYINAETTAGGFPGWGTYTPGSGEHPTPPILTPMLSENEYSGFQAPYTEDFVYESDLVQSLRQSGITVPLTVNDAWPGGHYTSVDVYGYDSYPNGFDCSHPYTWASDAVPEYFWGAHLQYNPQDLNAVYEFQGGAFDGWGGSGYSTCAVLTGPEFERVFYKNEFAMSTTYLNLYMIFGGTNWGGIAHPAIAEDRTLREKYYDLKLQASFTGNSALKTTQVLDVVGNKTGFYVVRQTDASVTTLQTYTLTLPTSLGTITVPTLGGTLSLNGQDSKIHVVDYAAGSTTLAYSTGEIMTWATIDGRDIILIYGNAGELHETAIKFTSPAPPAVKVVSGPGNIKQKVLTGGALALQYTTSGQTVVQVGSNTLLYILDRANAYHLGALAQYSTENPIIVKGGYLLRSVSINGATLALTGDLNTRPTLSLPEITSKYSDALWTIANHNSTVNPSDFDPCCPICGRLWLSHRKHSLARPFQRHKCRDCLQVTVMGGSAFAYSVWLDSTFIGSWEGDAVHSSYEGTFNFHQALAKGSSHIITILQDHMGYEEDWTAASDDFKIPRGIMGYSFVGSPSTTVSLWKVTGNLGGENYADTTRGPLNEGGLFAERQGWHLPGFNDASWASGKATSGISAAGVSFYRTKFDLRRPHGIDYPVSIVVTNSTINPHFRSQFYVNGYQFGKFVNHIGPQKSFPVPQGILNYQGENTLAVSLWAAGSDGAKLDSVALQFTAKVESSMPAVVNQPLSVWAPRAGAY
ncbi:glycoside hydrolase superfamily [Flammula alnicola]|nr:glycoside hydrolase superfamily [Flammula alnicola]